MNCFSQALVSLSYVGRCPSYKEYVEGSPAEQRAIRERWQQLFRTAQPGSDDFNQASRNLQRSLPPLYLIDNKNPCDRDEGEFSAQERFERGMTPAGDTSEDQGL